MANLNGLYKYSYIYKITNLINNKLYVGVRFTNIDPYKDKYFGSGQLLRKSIKKYGKSYFKKEVLEIIDINIWQEKEKYWIKKLKSHTRYGMGYNQTDGGDGTVGLKWSDINKEKLSKSVSKIIRTKESNIKRSLALKGKKFTKEHINRISQSLKGSHLSEESKRKIGKKKKLLFVNKENHPMYGKKHSIESILKIKGKILNK